MRLWFDCCSTGWKERLKACAALKSLRDFRSADRLCSQTVFRNPASFTFRTPPGFAGSYSRVNTVLIWASSAELEARPGPRVRRGGKGTLLGRYSCRCGLEGIIGFLEIRALLVRVCHKESSVCFYRLGGAGECAREPLRTELRPLRTSIC